MALPSIHLLKLETLTLCWPLLLSPAPIHINSIHISKCIYLSLFPLKLLHLPPILLMVPSDLSKCEYDQTTFFINRGRCYLIALRETSNSYNSLLGVSQFGGVSPWNGFNCLHLLLVVNIDYLFPTRIRGLLTFGGDSLTPRSFFFNYKSIEF